MKSLKSKLAIALCVLALWVSSVACEGGDGEILHGAEPGVAQAAYEYAECVRRAGDDLNAINYCAK